MDERIASSADASKSGAVERASAALREGAVVALPLETGYAFAARSESDALAPLLAAIPTGADADEAPIAARLLETPDALLTLAPPARLAHRLLVRRLAPGPVVFEVHASRLVDAPSSGPWRCGSWARVRVSASPSARALMRALADALVLCIEPSRDQPSEPALANAADALALLDAHDLGAAALALASASEPITSKAATIVRLAVGELTDPPFAIIEPGAYEERFIRAQLTRTALFICTGNTCRSPMAAALARSALEEQGEPDPAVKTRVVSAGVATAGGAPVAREGVQALETLGVPIDPRSRSRPLTRDLLARADVIFAMSASHALAVRSMDPSAADRVMLLDPDGKNIPDPVGGPQAVYDSTARRLATLVRQRMLEPWP